MISLVMMLSVVVLEQELEAQVILLEKASIRLAKVLAILGPVVTVKTVVLPIHLIYLNRSLEWVAWVDFLGGAPLIN